MNWSDLFVVLILCAICFLLGAVYGLKCGAVAVTEGKYHCIESDKHWICESTEKKKAKS